MNLFILLIPYSALVIGILVFAVINFLHIIFQAETTKFNTTVSLIFFIGIVTILVWSAIMFLSFDWTQSLFGTPFPANETFFE